MRFQFRNSYQKKLKWKKESTFIWIFSFLYPFCIFLHFKPKNSHKKDKNAKKKQKKNFSNCKNTYAKKKQKIIFQKTCKKSYKKSYKKTGGVYLRNFENLSNVLPTSNKNIFVENNY